MLRMYAELKPLLLRSCVAYHGDCAICIVGMLVEQDYNTSLITASLHDTVIWLETFFRLLMLTQHYKLSQNAPSWCPNYFGFDKGSLEDRVLALTLRQRSQTSDDSDEKTPTWTVTGTSLAVCTFLDNVLVSTACSKVTNLCHRHIQKEENRNR